jgi:hypothetical protein
VHKIIFIIIGISSITIKFACLNVFSVNCGYAIVVKYPFISILNIKCIVNACSDNCKATTPIITKKIPFVFSMKLMK